MVSPYRRTRYPTPPPTVSPPRPTEPVSPNPSASPCSAVALVNSTAVIPGPAQAVRPATSISSADSADRSSTSPSSQTPYVLCPPLRTASGKPVSRPNPMTRATSAASAARTITAGHRSTFPLNTLRARS